MTHTSRPGILSGGSFSGFKDISDSVICASAAALGACNIMHNAGKQTIQAVNQGQADGEDPIILPRENPRILTVLCCCNSDNSQSLDLKTLETELGKIPENVSTEIVDNICLDKGRDALIKIIQTKNPNRLVLGACLPCIQKKWIKELGKASKLHPSLIEGLDMISILKQYPKSFEATQSIERELKILISKARFKNPLPDEWVDSNQDTMVIGGGIAGITAALSLADCGFHVDLVEKQEILGGNLLWMDKTIDDLNIKEYLAKKCKQLGTHEQITIHTKTRVESVFKSPGEFATVLIKDDEQKQTIFHGVTILATGGNQAPLKSDRKELNKEELNKEDLPQIELTQKEFEIAVQNQMIDPEQLKSVVMIQCSGTREEKQNYCSRVCCIRALKNALFLKEKNPDVQVYIFYRDMMSYGFFEEYYTRAKSLGVIFFQYDPVNKPVIKVQKDLCIVKAWDLLLNMPVEIEADCVIHATGILPDLPYTLADQYGAALDGFHFFKEADSKFRPVDSMNYRVFSCGLSLKPCTIQEAISSAEACAARAIRILAHKSLVSGKTVAATHGASCSLCEMCVDTCPYGARFVDDLAQKIQIDPAACQGCGVCAAVCPSNSAFLEGFEGRQMLDAIDMALS